VSSSSSASNQIRLLLVEDVPQVAQYIKSLLNTQVQVKLLDIVEDGRQVPEQVHELRPDMLVIDSLLRGRVGGLDLITNLRRADVDLPILVLTVPQKPIRVTPEMGLVRIVSMPFSGYEFMNAVQEIHADYRAQAPESVSRIYTIFGAKGGVGGTTLAFNLAAAMAARTDWAKIALLDGSLQFGDVRALLRVPENAPSIVDLPTDAISKKDLADIVWRDPSGVDLYLAPPRVEMSEMITARDMEKLLLLLRRVYNVVIIDTPSSVNDTVLSYFDNSDQVIQVVSYESATLYQSRAMAITLHAMGFPPDKVHYLVNRADSLGGLPPDAISQFLGREPDFRVISDGRLVVEANNRGLPFVLAMPDAPISRNVVEIAEQLMTAAPPRVPVGAY
jgi:pilus assembly protein CpaE